MFPANDGSFKYDAKNGKEKVDMSENGSTKSQLSQDEQIKMASKEAFKEQPEKITDQLKSEDGTENVDQVAFEDLKLIPDDAKVYSKKVHKYKEIKGYIKGERLGKGVFGTVREFIHKETLKRYAGKIIKRFTLRKDPHLRRQINKELGITYHFDHPNIMRVYDLYTTDQKIYMFMEFCCGDLNEFLTAYGTLPKCQSKDFFGQICKGLDYLHAHGIIHRDIKPQNVLVSHSSKELKLADFGVCQNVDMFSLDDLVSGTDGSPLYCPPELYDQHVIHYSGSKMDIWAAAVILYQMIVGKVPFHGNEWQRDALLHKNPDYPESVREDILLHDLFNKLFEKNFVKRISIDDIWKHTWMQLDCLNKSEHYKRFPTDNRATDCYRSVTVLTRIHEKYYPTPNHETEKMVDYKEMEESKQIRPLVRGQRKMKMTKKADIKREKINFI